jgi:hypothetical protein
MTQLAFYLVAVLLLLGASALLLRQPRAGRAAARSRSADPAEFFPVHCRFFPQVRQTLSSEDSLYLAERASPAVRRQWMRSRRRAGRMYLMALREDFARLNRLARVLSRYSPQVKARQEFELLWLNLRFQLLYGMVVFRILLGRPAAEDLGRMASLIGGLGSRLEQAALTLHLPDGAVTP